MRVAWLGELANMLHTDRTSSAGYRDLSPPAKDRPTRHVDREDLAFAPVDVPIPGTLTQQRIMWLQRAAGNQAVQRMLRQPAAPAVQRVGVIGKVKKKIFERKNKQRDAEAPAAVRRPAPPAIELNPEDALVKTDESLEYRQSDDTFIVYGLPYTLQTDRMPIGRGGLGSVYLLEPRGHDGPKLAIKVPNADSIPRLMQRNELAALEDQNQKHTRGHQSFSESVGVIGGLKHPKFNPSMNEPPVNAIVMELIEGGSLAKWVGRSGLLASAYRRNTITYSEYVGVQQYVQREITRALQHLHDQGLAHMDLKPDNVMFTAHFRVKIIDLGSLTPQSGTNKNPPVTGKWRSPEYLSPPTGATQSDAVNTSYDMYGSGLMANEGIEPVFGATNYGTEGKLGKEAHEGTRKDTAATQFVKKVTEQDPGKRATAAEALDLPYLSESLLNDDQARAVLKFVSERQANPKAVKPASRRDEPAPPGPEQRSRFDEVLQELRQAEVFLVKAANAEADSVA